VVSSRQAIARRLGIGVLGWLALAGASAAADAPRIVTTVPPVHSLVAAVAEGAATPYLMLRGGASPHAYAMAPSDARALQEARLVVWVGPMLETFMVRALREPRTGRRLMALMDQPGMVIHQARAGGIFDAHAHEEDGEHHTHASEHAHGGDDHDGHEDHDRDAHDDHDGEAAGGHDDGAAHTDAHLWLDPRNALQIVALVADALADLDPERAALYRANAQRTAARLTQLDADLAAILDPVKDRPFIVFHDAYQYLEKRYGLTTAGAITVAPDRKPGARRLQEIRERLQADGVACVFAEPQFPPDVVTTLTEGTGVRAAIADPLGASLEPGPDLYPALMRTLARSLAECLTPHS
jgi:zinc transport system substrate-binding protein